MQWVRARQRVSTWVAAFAVLWISIAPAISQALQAGAGGVEIEVCSSLGPKFVKVDNLEDAQQPEASLALHHVLHHCPYCAAHLGIGTPPSAAVDVVLLAARFSVPQVLFEPTYTRYAWHHAPSRGPPHAA